MAARTLLFFWQSAVTDMIENFRDSQPILLFEFLARLPEEASTEQLIYICIISTRISVSAVIVALFKNG